MAYLSDIFIYPVKSMAPLSAHSAQVSMEGLIGDRRFMVITPDGHFVTARTHPKLQLISVVSSAQEAQAGTLRLRFPGMADLELSQASAEAKPIATGVWGDTFNGLSTHQDADHWLSTLLAEPVKLIWLGSHSPRRREKIATNVSFADGYPLLLIGAASLADLNQRASSHIAMSQFRTNLVIEGSDAFAEDGWQRIRIGEAEFAVAKPCIRCNMTTIMPGTETFHPQAEPLRTLRQYRQNANGEIHFGQNLLVLHEGLIRVGDKVEIL